MRAVGVDPGKMTGIARYDDGEFSAFEAECWYAVRLVDAMCENHEVDLVVCENFFITAGRKTSAPWSLESIGAIKLSCGKYGIELKLQPPADKAFADNAKLREVGWYTSTSGGHANDAARHLLGALVERGEIDPRRFL